METTHLFERLPIYAASRSKRLMKTPKAFWSDPGLAVFLSGYFAQDDLAKAREVGELFKTFIYHHLRVLASLMVPPARLYFWRTLAGQEVDSVVEHGRKLLAVEVKRTVHPTYSDASGLQTFLDEHPGAFGGLLVHCGPEIRRLGENIVALPWTMLTG